MGSPGTDAEIAKQYILDTAIELEPYLTDGISDTDNGVGETMAYSLNAGGKRIRPALVSMAADLFEIEPKSVYPLMIGLESLHTATLIFDDLPAQDNAELRRGMPTAHIAFPEYQAQLAGLSLFTRLFNKLTDLRTDFDGEKVLDVINYTTSMLDESALCLGQWLDLEGGEKTVDDLEEIARLKTSTVLELPLVSVGMLAGAEEMDEHSLARYGEHLGIAYQIRDDLKDGDSSKETGKDQGIDEANDKSTFITALGSVAAARERMLEHAEEAHDALSWLRAEDYDTQNLDGLVDLLTVVES